MKKIIGIIAVVIAFFAVDTALTYNNFIKDCDYLIKNDFEITQSNHPEKVWDKVFFGNSVVMSGYREEWSNAGYVNLGLSYGTMTDLEQMIKKHYIKIGSELVIGLNELTLYDDFQTNPTYIWHKKFYMPYAYFERDVFYPVITEGFDKLLHGENPAPEKRENQQKYVTYGMLGDDELLNTLNKYENEYFHLPDEAFRDNFEALDFVFEYCEKNNIRVRALWMPWNPRCGVPEIFPHILSMVTQHCDSYGVELVDLQNIYPEEYFFDTAHLNSETGAPAFTALMDEWL